MKVLNQKRVEKVLHCEDGKKLEYVAQISCGYPLLASVQGHIGWGFGKYV